MGHPAQTRRLDSAAKRGIALTVRVVGLLRRELAAGASDDVPHGVGFHELEPIAERASLANQGEEFYVAKGQRELQTNHLADRNFLAQQRRNSRLADVYRVSAHNRPVARIHANLYVQLEAAMEAGFH